MVDKGLLERTETIIGKIELYIQQGKDIEPLKEELHKIISENFSLLRLLFEDLSDSLCNIRDHGNKLKLKEISSSISMIKRIKELLK